MSLKFNCSNPECRQRVEVEEAMAGKTVRCPSCSASLQVPSSKDIRFNCNDPACRQHIVVDLSEAGRFLKCPACGKPQKIPGDPPKSLFSNPVSVTKTGGTPHVMPGSKHESRLANLIRSPLGRLASGWCLGLGILFVLAVVSRGWSQIGVPSNLAQKSDEIYNHGIGEFRDTPLQVHGQDLLYLKYIGNDVEVYDFNPAVSTNNLLTRIRNISQDMGFDWIGWSPDAKYFAYCAGADEHNQSLFLNDSNNGSQMEAIALQAPGKPVDGVWLSSNSLILAFDNGSLYILNFRPTQLLGKNGAPGLTKLPPQIDAGSKVVAVSDDAFAYSCNGAIWNFDLLKNAATRVVAEGNAEISRQTFSLKTTDGEALQNVFDLTNDNLESFTTDGQSLFGITSDSRGATFILRYDIAERRTTRLLQIQQGYKYCMATPPVEKLTTNSDGQPVEYYYLQPPNLDPGKKYPVLIDMTSSSRHDHGRDAEFLANCGIFYVSPNNEGIIEWGVTPSQENTLAVYEALRKNPNVDMGRIYIAGESVTTGAAAEMINANPELWRGFVAIEPASYPDMSLLKSGAFSALICMGQWDQFNGLAGGLGRAEKFALDAGSRRIAARIHYEPNTPHAFHPKQYKDAYEAVAKFILNEY